MLVGFGEHHGLDQEDALKLGRAFGAGMGMGNICGALLGALMVLGFKDQEDVDERQARYRTYDLARSLVDRFRSRHGTIVCKELLSGVDLSTEAGRKEAEERKLFTTVCPAFVLDAAEVLDEML